MTGFTDIFARYEYDQNTQSEDGEIITEILVIVMSYFNRESEYSSQYNECFSPSIIRIIKSRRIRWAGHVARMGRRGTRIDYWWESQRERDH
jgi:hypothetical protein